MTEILYMDNIKSNYIKEFYAIVIKNKKDYVTLNKTAFYPLGGGQPADIGVLKWNNNVSKVVEVIKKGDVVKHIIKGEKPQVGTKVKGIINWKRRYSHMKMHTAQHIISGIIYDKYKARTVGNQIHTNYSRVDFHPLNLNKNNLDYIKNKFNEIVQLNLPIKIYEEERDTLEKRVAQERANIDLLPKFVKKLRIIEIEGFDICPCAGTHVKNTNEIPKITNINIETKGKDKTRIIYSV
jgi:misacylated tRNA(Ala) deacylase